VRGLTTFAILPGILRGAASELSTAKMAEDAMAARKASPMTAAVSGST
jgi:hypothetical protein